MPEFIVQARVEVDVSIKVLVDSVDDLEAAVVDKCREIIHLSSDVEDSMDDINSAEIHEAKLIL